MSTEILRLNSCFCVSLRTGSIIFGGVQFFIFLLYLVDSTIFRIHYASEEAKMRYDIVLSDMLFQYSQTIQLIFSAVLLFGIIQEKSGFVVAWLLTEVTNLLDGIWTMAFIATRFHFHLEYFLQELTTLGDVNLKLYIPNTTMFIITGFNLLGIWVVHSYYRTMQKHKYLSLY